MDLDDSPMTDTTRSSLFGYAVLRANFNHNAPNYLDNFSAFVVDALAECYPEAADEAGIGEVIRTAFGLTIPDQVVGRLLRKLSKAGRVVVLDGRLYQLAESELKGLKSLREDMSRFEACQTELLSKFVAFVKENHGDSSALIDADPARHLQGFIDRYAAPILRKGISGHGAAKSAWGELRGAEYLVGSFVLHLEANDAATFGYLIDAVKGAILLGVLEIGPGDIRKKLDELTLVLDTPVILNALGYQGPIPQRAGEQLLSLARRLGVKLVCFEHTVKETDGVLEAAIASFKRAPRLADSSRAVYLHFLESGLSASDIVIAQASLHQNLQALGLRIIPLPDSYYKYGLDESALETLFKQELPSQRESTQLYDLQSLSAIHRLRKGSSPASFERCGYLLVTDNYGLTVVGRRVDERHLWPLAIRESEIASLLWVRSPAIADDLPRQQLIAAVYTAIQPPSHLWIKYVEEIEQLEERGSVDADEAMILRTLPEAREALMDVTLGESYRVDSSSVQIIVDRVRDNLTSPIRVEAADARAQRDRAKREADEARKERESISANVSSLRDKVAAFETEISSRDDRIRARAGKQARAIVVSSIVIIALVLIGPEIFNFVNPSLEEHLPGWLVKTFTGAGLVLIGIASFQQFVGGAVREWFRPIERRLAVRVEVRLRHAMGLSSPSSHEESEIRLTRRGSAQSDDMK